MARHIDTEIRIQAPPQRVWQVLTAFGEYPQWNPFIESIEGRAEPGTRLTVRMRMPDGKRHTFTPVVLQATAPHALRWLGRVGVPGVFDGEHGFFAAADGAGTLFRQTETFQGLLVPLLWRDVGPDALAGFEAMNVALKRRAESAGSSP